MFLRNETTTSTPDYWALIGKLKREIAQADALVIGAGAGLSTAAGLSYSGARFQDNFADFIAKYHYPDMYSAGFYPYPSPEEYWAYWSRHIGLNRYAQAEGALYGELLQLLRGRDYFVLTTNVDGCFQKAGVEKSRLFYTQGDYGLFQCSVPCHKETYDNEELVRRMVEEQKDMRIPSELVPHCPKCNAPMTTNLRCDSTFVEPDGWHDAAKRYRAFIERNSKRHVLFWELGVGENTPVIIKYPFWNMTHQNPHATYACINLEAAIAPREIQMRAICIGADIGQVIADVNAT